MALLQIRPNVPATAISAHYAQAAPSEISRRELYFFNLFRVFQATLIAGLIFSPLALNWMALTHETLAHGRRGLPPVCSVNLSGARAWSTCDECLNRARCRRRATTVALFAIKITQRLAMLLMAARRAARFAPAALAAFAARRRWASSASRSSAA
jgi:hypothetical protein